MHIVNGLLDYKTPWIYPDIYLFTGNPKINARGGVIMGRGAALEVRDAYKGIDRKLRPAVEACKTGVCYVEIEPKQWLGWFQVKYSWDEDADLELIQRSVQTLARHARHRMDCRFHLNCPGTGNGNLEIEDVIGLLIDLPDNVFIYL